MATRSRPRKTSKPAGPGASEKDLARQIGDDLAVALLDSGALRRAGNYHQEKRGNQCTIKPTILVRRGKADELRNHE